MSDSRALKTAERKVRRIQECLNQAQKRNGTSIADNVVFKQCKLALQEWEAIADTFRSRMVK